MACSRRLGTTGANCEDTCRRPRSLATVSSGYPPLYSPPLMSFQNFRLPPPGAQHGYDNGQHSTLSGASTSLSPPFAQLSASDSSTRMQSPSSSHYTENPRKGLYGSGDADDRYTLVFESMDAFEAWRQREEEEKMVEFVKGDTHASKAVPPRFKEHTKLKYVKKYPDRVRKVPSRKLEGMGCPASISYKTYFETDEVRACYTSDHSHEIGPANLPFTKRGRKAQAEMEARASTDRPRGRPRKERQTEPESSASPTSGSFMDDGTNAIAGPSSAPVPPPMQEQQQHVPQPPPQMGEPQPFQSAISMLAPLPQMQQPTNVDISQERWDRMGVLFQSIRDHARSFEFPAPSVAALESVLIRLYLESPIGGTMAAPTIPPMGPMHGGVGMGGAPLDGNHHGAGT
ncbi:hypothetical protein C8Q74DRAFT_1240416 [Fomes fomentarius]|nr:hypothetical protein C8Q74DRAFT_1240416 [Fomes fomentarius]